MPSGRDNEIKLPLLDELFTTQQERDDAKLKHIYNRMSMSFLWGRYNFIVIRKDISYDVLKYFGQKVSASSLLSYRIHILLKNIFGRSETTFIKF